MSIFKKIGRGFKKVGRRIGRGIKNAPAKSVRNLGKGISAASKFSKKNPWVGYATGVALAPVLGPAGGAALGGADLYLNMRGKKDGKALSRLGGGGGKKRKKSIVSVGKIKKMRGPVTPLPRPAMLRGVRKSKK